MTELRPAAIQVLVAMKNIFKLLDEPEKYKDFMTEKAREAGTTLCPGAHGNLEMVSCRWSH